MNAHLAPYKQWIENVIGCTPSDSVTFEFEWPFGDIVAEDILQGATLDRRCLTFAPVLRSVLERWELPPGVSPRIELTYSRDSESPITAAKPAWDPHWKETPVALWLKGLDRALVAVSIPYVSFANGLRHEWKDWLIVNRADVAMVLNRLSTMLANPPKQLIVIGGKDIPLSPEEFGWDSLVLEPEVVQFVKNDFDFFLQRESWFRRFRLPFRRGYLLYGPPGNGKTSVARAMASHPNLRAFSIDFSNEELHNDALTELFEAASHAAPSLVIFEDLERLYGNEDEGQNRTRITLQHLLNCLDGLGSKDGTIVVATANKPETLGPAILRRPGRFDRVVQLALPSLKLRCEYITKLSTNLEPLIVQAAAAESAGFSFAQLREAYILAGQVSFSRADDEITGGDLLEGIRTLRNGVGRIGGKLGCRETGFAVDREQSMNLELQS